MQNPFYNKNFTFSYLGITVIIITVYSVLVYFTLHVSWAVAVSESVISITLFAATGFGIWYVVKYNLSKTRLYEKIFLFIISGIMVVLVWFVFNMLFKSILIKLLGNNPGFIFNPLYHLSTGLFLFTILILVYQIIILFNKYAEKLKSEEMLKQNLAETKLNMLKAYINPHFLFNSLNSINFLIGTDNEKAREMIINLSEYFRSILKHKDQIFINFKEEYISALTYFKIEQERFGNKILFKDDIEESSYNSKIPVMILQPLFENIIKHAVSESLVAIEVYFKSYCDNDCLYILLENTYESEFTNQKKGTGLGLSSTFDRLYYIYNRRDLFQINKNEKKFSVLLKIPQKF
jgi:sensor histidine kinase YesM